jgi:DNA-directed RNA polymerase III subunit RPC7
MAPPVQRPLTRDERSTVQRFLTFREQVHNGPLYTVEAKKKGVLNAFEDVQRYSRRYEKKRQKVPRLDARPYVKELFPEELHLTLDPHGTTNGTTTRKTLVINTLSALDDVDGDDKNPLDVLGDEEDVAKPAAEDADGDEAMEDEVEDEFEEDEEGDYNADRYFEEDEADDYGDDDGGGGDYGGDW